MKYNVMSTVILSLPLIQGGQFKLLVNIARKVLVNRLGLSLPRKSVSRLLDRFDKIKSNQMTGRNNV